jgi:hypothetical protein
VVCGLRGIPVEDWHVTEVTAQGLQGIALVVDLRLGADAEVNREREVAEVTDADPSWYTKIMPLHDWNNRRGWSGVYTYWMTELARWVKPRLPKGYRVFLGNAPLVAVESDPSGQPDVAVRAWPDEPPSEPELETATDAAEPDVEVATLKLEPQITLFVEWEGRLIAVAELVSPRNKDRRSARTLYTARYAGYLIGGAHLLLVDVHPRPQNFSFADRIAEDLEIPQQPRTPPPYAVAYRVGEPAATGGRMVAIWRRPLTVGQPLPTIPLPISVGYSVMVDLEQTYTRAAADSYLD